MKTQLNKFKPVLSSVAVIAVLRESSWTTDNHVIEGVRAIRMMKAETAMRKEGQTAAAGAPAATGREGTLAGSHFEEAELAKL